MYELSSAFAPAGVHTAIREQWNRSCFTSKNEVNSLWRRWGVGLLLRPLRTLTQTCSCSKYIQSISQSCNWLPLKLDSLNRKMAGLRCTRNTSKSECFTCNVCNAIVPVCVYVCARLFACLLACLPVPCVCRRLCEYARRVTDLQPTCRSDV